jgi:hypothetical protein
MSLLTPQSTDEMAVVMLANRNYFQTNRSIVLFDLTVVRWFQRVASTFHNASQQPNRGTTQNGFCHNIQHSIPHAVTKADSPFIVLGVRWNAKHYCDVTMDQSAEHHFCDGCPDRRP